MPQATSAPTTKQANSESAEDRAKREAAEKAEREWLELVKRATDGDSPATRQIERALRLEREISALRQSVNDNRDYLRLMDRNEELNDDQSEFLDVWYPEKEKGERRPPEEVEATRRAKALARKNGKDTDDSDDDE